MVRGLVERQYVGALPKRHGYLDLLAFPKAEFVEPPGHIVSNAQILAQRDCAAREIACEVVQQVGRGNGVLRAVRCRALGKDAADVGLGQAACDAHKRALPAAVIADDAAPAFGKRSRDMLDGGCGRPGVGVADIV